MAARRRSARSNEPSGYYFAVGPGREDDGWDCTVYMTDAVYFDMTGNPSDWRITPELTRGGMLLPPGLTEGAMGVFTYEGQPGEAQERLLARGFRMTAAFTSLVSVINLEREELEQEQELLDDRLSPIPPGRDRVRGNPITNFTPEGAAFTVSEILGTTPTRRPRNPERVPRGRKEAVAKKPPGKTIWERLDEEDD